VLTFLLMLAADPAAPPPPRFPMNGSPAEICAFIEKDIAADLSDKGARYVVDCPGRTVQFRMDVSPTELAAADRFRKEFATKEPEFCAMIRDTASGPEMLRRNWRIELYLDAPGQPSERVAQYACRPA